MRTGGPRQDWIRDFPDGGVVQDHQTAEIDLGVQGPNAGVAARHPAQVLRYFLRE